MRTSIYRPIFTLTLLITAFWLQSLLNVDSDFTPRNEYLAPTFAAGYVGIAFLVVISLLALILTWGGKLTPKVAAAVQVLIITVALLFCWLF